MNMDTWLKQPTVPFSAIKDGDTAELSASNVRMYEFQTEYGLIRIAMAFCEDLPKCSSVSNGVFAVYETDNGLHYEYIGFKHMYPIIIKLKTFLIVGEYFGDMGFTKDGLGCFAPYEPVMLTSGLLV